jgi:hypothetical protein
MKAVKDAFRLWLSLRPAQRVFHHGEVLSLVVVMFGMITWKFGEYGVWSEEVFHLIAAFHAAFSVSWLSIFGLSDSHRNRIPGALKRCLMVQGFDWALVAFILSTLHYWDCVISGGTSRWGVLVLKLFVLQSLVGSLLLCLFGLAWVLNSDSLSSKSWLRVQVCRGSYFVGVCLVFAPLVAYLTSHHAYWLWVGFAPSYGIYRLRILETEWAKSSPLSWLNGSSRGFFESLWRRNSLFYHQTMGCAAGSLLLLQSAVLIPGFLAGGVVFWILATLDGEGVAKMPFAMTLVGWFVICDVITRSPVEVAYPGLLGCSRKQWATRFVQHRVAAWLAAIGFCGLCWLVMSCLSDSFSITKLLTIDRLGRVIPGFVAMVAMVGQGVFIFNLVAIPLRLRNRPLPGFLHFPPFRWNSWSLPAVVLFLACFAFGIDWIKTHGDANLFDPGTWNGLAVPLFVLGFLLLGVASWVWSFRLQYRAILERDLV